MSISATIGAWSWALFIAAPRAIHPRRTLATLLAANAQETAADRKPCGQQMANVPAGAIKGAISHDTQTEGYYIISGAGTPYFIDGTLVNGEAAQRFQP